MHRMYGRNFPYGNELRNVPTFIANYVPILQPKMILNWLIFEDLEEIN